MNKIPALLAGFLSLTFLLQAQEKQPKFLAELAIGPSFPIGKFGDKSYGQLEDDEPAGLAKSGLNAQVSLGYYLNESFGVLLSPSYSVHAQDGSGVQEFMKQFYLSGGLRISRVDVDPQSWKIVKLMAGGFLVTPLTVAEDLVLQSKLTAGACKTAVPALSYTGYDDNGMTYGGKLSKNSLPWAFCYQVSLGLKYKLNNSLRIFFDVNSFNATPKKEYTLDGNTLPNPQPSRTITTKYKLAEVNAMVGVGIDL